MHKSVQQLHPLCNEMQVASLLQFPNFCGQAEFCAVFFAQVGSGNVNQVVCPERLLELQQIGNAHLAEQKLSAWLLLQQVLERCLSADLNNVEFCKHPSGKWTCNLCEFSISHCGEVICVAISNAPVGVDVESTQHFTANNKISLPRLLQRIATTDEQNVLPTTENVMQLWTKKEAIFKSKNQQVFLSKNISTLQENAESFTLDFCQQQLVVSVCGNQQPTFFVAQV